MSKIKNGGLDQGRVANSRPVAKIKTGRVSQTITDIGDATGRVRSWIATRPSVALNTLHSRSLEQLALKGLIFRITIISKISASGNRQKIYLVHKRAVDKDLFNEQHLGKIDAFLYHLFVFLYNLLMSRQLAFGFIAVLYIISQS